MSAIATTRTSAALARRLLSEQPVVLIERSLGVRAHVATDVFGLWERWEAETRSREEPPFWAVVWPGAALMAGFLAEHPEWVVGRRVVDVGCGSGIAAVAAAKAGAATVVANDLDPVSLAITELTASLNGVRLQSCADDLCAPGAPQLHPELVLVCEMFYEASVSERMQRWLDDERARGARVLLADGGRPFLPHARVRCLHRQRVDTDAALEGAASREVGLYEWL